MVAKQFRVETRIREHWTPEIESHSSVDVSITNLGVTMFAYDQLGENTRSEYISLTRDEAIALRDLLVKEVK